MFPDELLYFMVSSKPGCWIEFLAICTHSGSKFQKFSAFDLKIEQQQQGRHVHHNVTCYECETL